MKQFFSSATFNFSCVAILGIAVLFYYFSKSIVNPQTHLSPQFELSDLSEGITDTTSYASLVFDSIKIRKRTLTGYENALDLLKQKLRACKTDTDSIDVCTAFVFRVFDFGGTHNPQFPGEKWTQLSFEEMYAYAQYDSGGIYCGQRTRALEKLLQHVGFTDMMEYDVKGIHTFLLLRVKGDRAWIADGYGLWGMTVNGTRTDFVTYLKAANQKYASVKCIQLPAVFGLPEDLQNIETVALLKNESNSSLLRKSFCKECQSNTLYNWLPRYLFAAEDTSKFKFKLMVKRDFAEWADGKLTGRNAVTIWLAPDSVAKVSYYLVKGTDVNWANKVIQEISSIRSN